MELNECPIWGTSAKIEVLPDDKWSVDSPRAGGKYTISRTGRITMEDLSDDQKALVTFWLVGQRLKGVAHPVISDNMEIDSIRPPSVSQRTEKLLQYIKLQLSNISAVFKYPHYHTPQTIVDKTWKCDEQMLAWSASIKRADVDYLLWLLENKDWINRLPSSSSRESHYTLTEEGHAHLDNSDNPRHQIPDSTPPPDCVLR